MLSVDQFLEADQRAGRRGRVPDRISDFGRRDLPYRAHPNHGRIAPTLLCRCDLRVGIIVLQEPGRLAEVDLRRFQEAFAVIAPDADAPAGRRSKF